MPPGHGGLFQTFIFYLRLCTAPGRLSGAASGLGAQLDSRLSDFAKAVETGRRFLLSVAFLFACFVLSVRAGVEEVCM